MKYRVHNARFLSKATPKPVTAKHVQSQHQIDLTDLSKDPVKHNGKVYKYVPSVIDVFRRFLWLVPMESKSSSHKLFECCNHFMTNMVHKIAFRATAAQNLKANYVPCANDKIRTLSSAIARKGRAISPTTKEKRSCTILLT